MVRRHDGEVVAPVEHQLRYAIGESICRETSFPRELFDGILVLLKNTNGISSAFLLDWKEQFIETSGDSLATWRNS